MEHEWERGLLSFSLIECLTWEEGTQEGGIPDVAVKTAIWQSAMSSTGWKDSQKQQG